MSRAPDADGWVSLSDSQWTNIVNHDHAYQSMSKDDAVHLAVKMTEAKCRELNVDAKALTKLRDDFASKAMQGWLSSFGPDAPSPCFHQQEAALAIDAYKIADAMLAERAK